MRRWPPRGEKARRDSRPDGLREARIFTEAEGSGHREAAQEERHSPTAADLHREAIPAEELLRGCPPRGAARVRGGWEQTPMTEAPAPAGTRPRDIMRICPPEKERALSRRPRPGRKAKNSFLRRQGKSAVPGGSCSRWKAYCCVWCCCVCSCCPNGI